MLNDTDEETSKRPIAVRSGRRSGRASATILRKDAEVEDVPPALEREAGRRRERMERRIGGGGGVGGESVGDVGDDGRGFGGAARGVELATKERRWAKMNGHGGYRRLVEGCAKVRRTSRAPPRPRAVEERVGVATRRRRCRENITHVHHDVDPSWANPIGTWISCDHGDSGPAFSGQSPTLVHLS
jgi:hypothetical protein